VSDTSGETGEVTGRQVRAHVQVTGRVQGVFFRSAAAREATRLGLGGWVRNLPDGSVEAVAEGPEEDVRAFVDWCRTGPETAWVDALDVRWSVATGEHDAFAVRR
jgi:acylphosphatase